MSAQPAPMNARRVMELLRNGLGAPLALMAMLAMLMVPLAAPVLDALFTFNIAISLMVLLAVVYVQRPLEFTIFPIVLLMTTMLRLALNVASSRVILINGQDGHAAAGKVIEAFGQFVIGGNYAVGIVVFAILTIINFVVITKGAGRVSEVTARFILDAMPGKQMAIDADLNAGLLTREEAKARREEVREEADFYGAMDGANKFIRGDAIAAILILFINLIGGMAVGMLQHNMSFIDAASTYTLLSIGDGLVAQLPALLVSSSVALLVTRASRAQDMRGAMISQVFGQHRALAVAAAILGLVGLVPGMPNVAFLTLGLILGVIAWKMYKRSLVVAPTGEAATDPKAAAAATAAAASAELSWDELRPIDPLGLEVGYRLIPLVDKNQGGELMARTTSRSPHAHHQVHSFCAPPVGLRARRGHAGGLRVVAAVTGNAGGAGIGVAGQRPGGRAAVAGDRPGATAQHAACTARSRARPSPHRRLRRTPGQSASTHRAPRRLRPGHRAARRTGAAVRACAAATGPVPGATPASQSRPARWRSACCPGVVAGLCRRHAAPAVDRTAEPAAVGRQREQHAAPLRSRQGRGALRAALPSQCMQCSLPIHASVCSKHVRGCAA